MGRLSNALIADIAATIGNFHTHTQINNIFTRAGAPGEPPQGSKIAKTEAWLRLANEDPTCDEIALLGRVLEELMDRDFPGGNREYIDKFRADVVRALGSESLSYRRGGAILGATLATPSRSLEDLIRGQKLDEIEKEFDRALKNVESDPPAATTAACAILEALFKVIIADEGLTLPADQTVLPLWKVVQGHLGLKPKNAVDPDDRKMLQGLATTIDGIAGRRTKAGSAHGRGPGARAVEPRHARLAVHAAHTIVRFVIESRRPRDRSD